VSFASRNKDNIVKKFIFHRSGASVHPFHVNRDRPELRHRQEVRARPLDLRIQGADPAASDRRTNIIHTVTDMNGNKAEL
jgi:hypothetical protein